MHTLCSCSTKTPHSLTEAMHMLAKHSLQGCALCVCEAINSKSRLSKTVTKTKRHAADVRLFISLYYDVYFFGVLPPNKQRTRKSSNLFLIIR